MMAAVESITVAMLWANLRVAFLLVAVYGLLQLARSGVGAFRHDVWLAALTACLALPLMSALLPTLSIPVLPPAPSPDLSGTTAVLAETAPSASAAVWLLGTAYAAGVISVLCYFAFAVLRLSLHERVMSAWPDAAAVALLASLRRDLGIRRPVELLCGDWCTSPYTWRLIRPRIVLPKSALNWPAARLRNALLHELCHIERLDWLRLGLQRLAVAVYWFNPLVWMAARQSNYEAERACDDFVLRSGGVSSEYAEQLVDLMQSKRRSNRFGIALGDSFFSKRVRSILRSPSEEAGMSKLKAGIVLAGTALAALSIAACQATGQTVDRGASRDVDSELRAEQESRAVREAEQREVELMRQRAEQEAELMRKRAAEEAELARERTVEEAELARERAAQEAELARRRTEQEAEQSVRAAELRAVEAELAENDTVDLLEQRTRALYEVQIELAQMEATVSELQMSLQERTAALSETERALQTLQQQLEQSRPE